MATESGIVRHIDLHFFGGGSDKVYHIAVEAVGDGTYRVPFAYGRRGNTLNRGYKTTSPVSLGEAERVYQKYIGEKTGKGYEPSPGVSGRVFSGQMIGQSNAGVTVAAAPAGRSKSSVKQPAAATLQPAPEIVQTKEKSGFLPQLLTPIEERDVERLIGDNSYCAQEKKNGTRLMVENNGAGIRGANKKGFVIPVGPDLAEPIAKVEHVLLDGENVGKLYVFDILNYSGRNLRGLPYSERLEILNSSVAELLNGSNAIEIVYTAYTTEEKRALLVNLKASQGEGVVFKRLDAEYTEGRTDSQYKFKFIESATVLITAVNTQRSVKMAVVDDKGKQVFVGNVTIPANKAIPQPGSFVEVEYLYAYEGGSLYQPVYIGPREDSDLSDCKQSQLKYYKPLPFMESKVLRNI